MNPPQNPRDHGIRTHPLLRLLVALRPDPRRTALAVLAGVGALAAAIALLGTSGWLITRAAQQPPVLYLMVAVVAVRALGIGRGVLRYAERLVSHDVALRGLGELREELYLRMARADPGAVAGLRRGDLLARVGADADAVADALPRAVLPMAVAALAGTGTVVAATLVLPAAGLVLLVSLVVAGVLAPVLAGAAARATARDVAEVATETAAEVHALLSGAAELAVAGEVPARVARVEALAAERTAVEGRAGRPAAAAAGLAELAGGGGLLGVLLVGLPSGVSPLLLAVIVFLALAAAEVTRPLPAAAVAAVRAGGSARRLTELLDLPAAGRSAVVTSASFPGRRGTALAARGLSAGWPGRGDVIQDVDLDLPRGRRVALVGASGSGKSTLLAALAGLLPASAGSVVIAGEGLAPAPITTVDPDLVRDRVQYVAADAHVFTTTVRENLRVAEPGADDDAIVRALRRADLGGWLADLSTGLDAELGSGDLLDGVALSGGERRRLLLARALLRDPAVLLLDEPAEHLSPDAADALVHGVLAGELVPSGRTVVIATHRLAALAAADEILVLADGRVEARGTHDWLLAHHGPYRAAHQAGG